MTIEMLSPEDNGWLPIETAPKDSKARLVYCPEYENIFNVFWDDIDWDWRFFGGNGGRLRETPTHWMPLPPPPPPTKELT